MDTFITEYRTENNTKYSLKQDILVTFPTKVQVTLLKRRQEYR